MITVMKQDYSDRNVITAMKQDYSDYDLLTVVNNQCNRK